MVPYFRNPLCVGFGRLLGDVESLTLGSVSKA